MKKTKIALTATTLAILSLMISAYHVEPQALPSPPHNRPVSEIIEMDKAYAPTIETPSLASVESQQISTHSENISKPVSLQEFIFLNGFIKFQLCTNLFASAVVFINPVTVISFAFVCKHK